MFEVCQVFSFVCLVEMLQSNYYIWYQDYFSNGFTIDSYTIQEKILRLKIP